MKGCAVLFCGWTLCLALAACHRQPTTPVVHVKPVEVVPFEDGYELGYMRGREAAEPKAKLPAAEDVEKLARDEAAKDAERDAKWERGFGEGYLAGFRSIATGQK